MIKEIIVNGEKLINVPADHEILIKLGLSEQQAIKCLQDYQSGKELEKIRMHRAPLLIEADHLVNIAMDKGADIAPFRSYRQALRDVTLNYQVFSDVVWPDKPTV
ncbi:phage tail assembly chaperone [Vibrio harveyi]|uniref:phage tail assembly chaperone n=1 Tax=Vibrio harveyi TaxID=669 RepID=UPI003CF90B0F